MALKQITFENFKGASASHALGHKNKLSGFSGSGKSRLKDALAFAFCGTDSHGTRNPTHLISLGEDKLSVSITTDKATITRTLTRKGNGSLKVNNGMIDTTYTQTQFEGMIGAPDVFLSGMIPGYLFQLTPAKRMEVLTEVLPKIDRASLVTELLGFEMSNEEKIKYGINRRADLVASSISVDRRTYEVAISEKTGRISQLKEMKRPTPPVTTDKSEEIARFDGIKQAWLMYEAELKTFNARGAMIKRITDENKYREEKRVALRTELNTLKMIEPDSFKPNDAELKAVRAELKPEPQEPLFINEIMADHCSTCGQVVAPRYREQVKVSNESKRNEYLGELENIRIHNNSVQSRIKIANDAFKEKEKVYLDMVETNRKKQARAFAVNLEIGGLVDQEIPAEVPQPVAPEILYDKEHHLKLIEENNTYNRQMGAYNVQLQDFEASGTLIGVIEKEIELLTNNLNRYKKMEEVFKSLPEIETSRSIGVFNTDILVFNGEDVTVSGMPLKMLSTGERLSVYLYFAYEVNSRMKRPHNIIFMDDADLISSEAWSKVSTKSYDSSKFQYFLAHVVEGQPMTVEVLE